MFPYVLDCSSKNKKINPFLKSNPPAHKTAVFEILLLFRPYNHDYSKRKQGCRK
jgi:hypothetical protein